MEITAEEYGKISKCVTLDLRSDDDRAYGFIPDSVKFSESALPENKDIPVVVYCARGEASVETAEKLTKAGYKAYSLKGGFSQWMVYDSQMHSGEDICKKTEQSLRTKFRSSIMSPFTRAIKEYQLINDGDKIAVCISGGKDSMLLAKLFQELQIHGKVKFEAEYIVMDPGYSALNRKMIEDNARMLNVPVKIFNSDIFDSVFTVEKSPCYLCARMRRGHLYAYAKELGCNKIALGHHYDDVIETVLMGMLYGAQIQTMMPKLHSTNFEGMELIRPLYLVREDDIKSWRDYNGLHFLQCACKFTEMNSLVSDGKTRSKRQEIKELIREMKKTNPDVEKCIFKSVENVCLDTVIAYKKDGVRHNFLEEY